MSDIASKRSAILPGSRIFHHSGEFLSLSDAVLHIGFHAVGRDDVPWLHIGGACSEVFSSEGSFRPPISKHWRVVGSDDLAFVFGGKITSEGTL